MVGVAEPPEQAGQNGTMPRWIATLLSWTGGVVWMLLLALGIVLANEAVSAHREEAAQAVRHRRRERPEKRPGAAPADAPCSEVLA